MSPFRAVRNFPLIVKAAARPFTVRYAFMEIHSPSPRRIAVTGMALCNALGHHIDEVWQRTRDMRSGLALVRSLPGDPPHFFEPPFRPGHNSYCHVMGQCGLTLTRQDLQLPPQDFDDMPMSTKLTLHAARQAMEVSGLPQAGYDPARVGVFISQNAGEAASTLWPLNLCLRAPHLADLAARHGGWDAATRDAFVQALREEGHLPSEGSMLGRINCMAAGMICQRYGFGGPAFSVGAACSSSMAALFSALQLLRNGTIDAAVIGGGEEVYAPLYLAEFSALGALARPDAHVREPEDFSRPFDLHRNGFVLGEGAGMLVLEREDKARQRKAPLHGLLTGMGHVTNSRGLIEPDTEAQIRAMRLSFAGLDYGPEAVDLVETHATGTVQGDLGEARALAAVYGHKSRPTTLSAYKGQIGHTTGASGVMAIIHGLLSMRDGIYPGTRNCPQPDPAITWTESSLRLFAAPEAWDRPESGIRRLQVSSFAFGGACFALQAEEPNDRCPQFTAAVPDALTSPHASHASVALATPETAPLPDFHGQEDVANGVRLVTLDHQGESWRLGSTTPQWLQEMAGLPTNPTPEDLAALSRKGLWLHRSDAPPPVAIMCCGQGSVWTGMGRALYDTFPVARAAMDRIAAVAGWDVLALMDEQDLDKIVLTRWQQPYLFLLEYAQACQLESLGFQPTVMSGHSLGELIALCLAGVYTPEQAWYILDSRATYMADLEARADSSMGMMAVYGNEAVVEQTLRDFPGLCVSNYNTPTQFILSGPRAQLSEARRTLRKNKTPAVLLNVSMAFHHPHMRQLRDVSIAKLNTIDMKPPRLPMFSNVTTGLYPDDRPSISEYIGDLDENAVRWVECVRKIWKDYGVRHFVELGPADTLCGLTTDIEGQAVCVPAGRKNKEVEGMRTAMARLHALGHLPRRHSHAVPDDLVAPVSASAVPVGSSPSTPAPHLMAAPAAPGVQDHKATVPAHVEDIMPLVMQATGYQRDELAPDMDLRHDLAIRSSRFPLIMSAAEERFGITMRFEDLMGVATIRDLADVLARLREAPVEEDAHAAAKDAAPKTASPQAPLPVLRYVPKSCPLPLPCDGEPLPAAPVLVVGDTPLAQRWTRLLAHIYGSENVHTAQDTATALSLLRGPVHAGPSSTATPGASAAVPTHASPWRGLVLAPTEHRTSADGVAPCGQLSRSLQLLQAFLVRRDAALCLVAQEESSPRPSPLHEGLAAMLLSVAMEYPRVHVRCVWATVDKDTAPDAEHSPAQQPEHFPAWMRAALLPAPLPEPSDQADACPAEPSAAPAQAILWRVRDGILRSPQLRAHALDVGTPGLPLRPGDVLVVSGGTRGITPTALRGFAAMGCSLALLSRNGAPTDATRALETLASTAEGNTAHGLSGGLVRCYPCDVTDPAAVEQTLRTVYEDMGRIDGVIHAAGLTLDATLSEMTTEAMETVLNVKCRGLYHMLEAALPHGLRYAVAFSSLAAWLGNYGQCNYSAANRAMGALLQQWCSERRMPWRCVWLPPVQGGGMADGEDVRRLLAQRGLDRAWLDVSELEDLLTREMLCAHGGNGPMGGHSVWARALPKVPGVPDAAEPTAAALRMLAERPQRFPLVFPLALRHEAAAPSPVFTGGHHFSHYSDTALPQAAQVDNVPCAPLELLLACLEEAAVLPWPWMQACGLREVRCPSLLPCPAGVTREAEITATPDPAPAQPLWAPGLQLRHTSLRVRHISANGRRQDRWDEVCSAEVLLSTAQGMADSPPLLWHAPAADKWAEAAAQLTLQKYTGILSLENIAHGNDSRYAWKWCCFKAVLRAVAQHLPGEMLFPAGLRSLRVSSTPEANGPFLLEIRFTPCLGDTVSGGKCCDVQLTRTTGEAVLTIQELHLIPSQAFARDTTRP